MRERYYRLLRFLRAARRRADITQVDLAHRLQRSQSFISKYESGEQELSLVEFAEIALAIGVDGRAALGILLGRATPPLGARMPAATAGTRADC